MQGSTKEAEEMVIDFHRSKPLPTQVIISGLDIEAGSAPGLQA